MPKLDLRLKTVASKIRSRTHVDIGSDHANLLIALLKSGRISRGIAIENKRQPFQNSSRALEGLNADVRFGDGLAMIGQDEADSLSICGMGAQSIVNILGMRPSRVPERMVLQPNRRPDLVRRWAFDNGYHLNDESIAQGHWPYQIMSFVRADSNDDPAYHDVDRKIAMLFGPLTLKQRSPDFLRQLESELEYLEQLPRLSSDSRSRMEQIRQVIAD